ncbi:MAG TPA: hypothetical protein DCX60_02615 [Phycisphaerales bacterium]|nr:hypothetical protein [Phycisphaerales bacterium]
MNLPVLILIVSLLLAAEGFGGLHTGEGAWSWILPLSALSPAALGVMVEMVVIRRTIEDASAGFISSIRRATLRLRILQWVSVLCCAIALLVFGWLELIRSFTGDLILIDELLGILPGLCLLALLWLVQWPLERLVQESLLMRRLDMGLPIHPIPSRWGHVIQRARTHMFLILVPMLTILLMLEALEAGANLILEEDVRETWSGVLRTSAALVALLLVPAVLMRAIGAGPLHPGGLRDMILTTLKDANVRARDVMLWPTGGTMVNGAVIGLIPSRRFVLLTDELLERLPSGQIRAVVAHEAGHIRHRHLAWTIVSLLALVGTIGVVIEWSLAFLLPFLIDWFGAPVRTIGALEVIGVMLVVVLTFLCFGWISRRFELQADASAARDLTVRGGVGDDTAALEGRLDEQATMLMCGALDSVSRINGVDPNRHTWRHGSIRWRQNRLRALIGTRLERLSIDHDVRRIKFTMIMLMIFLGIVWVQQTTFLDPFLAQ